MKVKELLKKLKNADLEDDVMVGELGKELGILEVKEVILIPTEVILGY